MQPAPIRGRPSPASVGSAIGLLILRVAFGSMMLFGHGVGKLGRLGADEVAFPDPLGFGPAVTLGVAIFAEVLCAGLLVIGFATRLAAVPLMATMLVAALGVHLADPWTRMELPLLYAAGFATLLLTGAGPISLDGWLGARRARIQ